MYLQYRHDTASAKEGRDGTTKADVVRFWRDRINEYEDLNSGR